MICMTKKKLSQQESNRPKAIGIVLRPDVREQMYDCIDAFNEPFEGTKLTTGPTEVVDVALRRLLALGVDEVCRLIEEHRIGGRLRAADADRVLPQDSDEAETGTRRKRSGA